MNCEQKKSYNVLASECAASRNFLKFSSVEVIMREERTNVRQQATTSNEFVAIVTFP